jgi:C4-type Zn-finger protein
MEEKMTDKTAICKCPYCDAEIMVIEELSPFCQACSITIITCEHCGGKARDGAEECPECGEKL